MSAHTPGPWRALDKAVTPDTDDLSCIGAIATAHVRRSAAPIINAQQARANAKMMAAAPTLAEQLEEAVSILRALRAGVAPPVALLDCIDSSVAALRAAGRLP